MYGPYGVKVQRFGYTDVLCALQWALETAHGPLYVGWWTWPSRSPQLWSSTGQQKQNQSTSGAFTPHRCKMIHKNSSTETTFCLLRAFIVMWDCFSLFFLFCCFHLFIYSLLSLAGNVNNHFTFSPSAGSNTSRLILASRFDYDSGLDKSWIYRLRVYITDDNLLSARDKATHLVKTGTVSLSIRVIPNPTTAITTTVSSLKFMLNSAVLLWANCHGNEEKRVDVCKRKAKTNSGSTFGKC